MATQTHQFIYPKKETNRPHHNHAYIKTTELHRYPTKSARQDLLYIPNPYQYSKTHQPNHSLNNSTQQHSSVWNLLPENLRKETKLRTFKKSLKKHLLEKQEIF
eukprot:Lithocolla_globosa_v1_NODE_1140_length_2841_cov_107.463747.p3 type:complete len:104 gc:universal NODE_1140_length_2841_cov_107.463747:2287-2598(+)